jgi:hypothetical protein
VKCICQEEVVGRNVGIEVWFDRVVSDFIFLLVGDRTNGALERVVVSRKR